MKLKETYTTDELCDLLSKTRKTIYNWRQEGLPFHRQENNEIIFKVDEVTEWLKHRSEETERRMVLVQKAHDVAVESKLSLAPLKKIIANVERFELLQSLNVNVDNIMQNNYRIHKDVLEKSSKQCETIKRVDDLSLAIEYIMKQRPLHEMQDELLIEYTEELKELIK